VTPKLTTDMMVGALLRQIASRAGFGAVIRKGDPSAGQIILQLLENGTFTGLYTRVLTPEKGYQWLQSGPQDIDNETENSAYLSRQIARDPDLWIVELDIPDATQLIAELNTMG
jgi:hypothetical protein